MRNSSSSVPTPKIKHVDACKFGVIYFWFHCQFLASYLYVYSFHVTVDATIIKILHDFTASPIVSIHVDILDYERYYMETANGKHILVAIQTRSSA